MDRADDKFVVRLPSPADDRKLQVARIPCAAAGNAAASFDVRLPILLSMVAGMVDLTGFYKLGGIFTAHITGNLVVAAALLVRGGPVRLAQLLAIPAFTLALATVWLISKVSGRRGIALARWLLVVQFLLLAAVLILTVITRASSEPLGLNAGIAVMIAVSAMACQYALLRLAIPGAISTAVMTGNLTNAVLAAMDLLARKDPFLTADKERLKRSLHLLAGFFIGCMIAAVAVSLLSDWAWLVPVALSGVAIALT